jgi:hypothetical protein
VTDQSALVRAPALPDPGAEAAQLRHVLALVEEMAGRPASAKDGDALEEAARIGASYAEALPIARRRFDALAAEASAMAAAGVEALLALEEKRRPTRAAAARLADELAGALGRLGAILSA